MTRQNHFPKADTALATVLLIGILILAYGYYQQSHIAFYLGLIVIVAGVLSGILRIILRAANARQSAHRRR